MDRLIVFIDGACEPKNPGGVPTYGYGDCLSIHRNQEVESTHRKN
jgi:ribonuclease HI